MLGQDSVLLREAIHQGHDAAGQDAEAVACLLEHAVGESILVLQEHKPGAHPGKSVSCEWGGGAPPKTVDKFPAWKLHLRFCKSDGGYASPQLLSLWA